MGRVGSFVAQLVNGKQRGAYAARGDNHLIKSRLGFLISKSKATLLLVTSGMMLIGSIATMFVPRETANVALEDVVMDDDDADAGKVR